MPHGEMREVDQSKIITEAAELLGDGISCSDENTVVAAKRLFTYFQNSIDQEAAQKRIADMSWRIKDSRRRALFRKTVFEEIFGPEPVFIDTTSRYFAKVLKEISVERKAPPLDRKDIDESYRAHKLRIVERTQLLHRFFGIVGSGPIRPEDLRYAKVSSIRFDQK